MEYVIPFLELAKCALAYACERDFHIFCPTLIFYSVKSIYRAQDAAAICYTHWHIYMCDKETLHVCCLCMRVHLCLCEQTCYCLHLLNRYTLEVKHFLTQEMVHIMGS